MIRGQDIICLSPFVWDAQWQAPQQIMSRLAEANRVLLLELPISPLSPFTGSHRGMWQRQIGRWLHGPRKGPVPALTIAAPPPVFPFRYHKLTNYLTQKILLRYLDSASKKLHFKNPILVTFQPDSGVLVRGLEASVKVYYCQDDWTVYGQWWQPGEKVRQRETELVEDCDLVFATSQRLTSKMEKLGKPTYFVPNAADFALFSQARSATPPAALETAKHPVIGFVGMISSHSFDDELMFWLAERHPEWTFVIAGKKSGMEPDLSRLEGLSNVRFVGFQPLDMIPKYLAGMDVCLIPRRQTEWVKSAFSLKIFEYLGAGKPVVAMWSQEFVPYEKLVYLPHDYPEFEQSILTALQEDSSELALKRMELARENTWEARIEFISKIFEDFLEARGDASETQIQ